MQRAALVDNMTRLVDSVVSLRDSLLALVAERSMSALPAVTAAFDHVDGVKTDTADTITALRAPLSESIASAMAWRGVG